MCALFLGTGAEAYSDSRVLEIGLILRINDKLNGAELVKGAETARSLFEKTHSKIQIKFHRFSHDDDLDSVAKAAQEVVKRKIPAVIGGELSEEAFVLRDSFKGKNIALISPSATNPEVSRDQSFVFRFSPSDQHVASDLAKMTLKRTPRAIGIVNNVSSPYSSYMSRQFLDTLMSEQTKANSKTPVIEEKIIDDTVDLDKQIQHFISKNVSHVMIPVHPSDFVQFVTQARAKKYFPTYIGGDGWGGSENLWKRLIKDSSDVNASSFVAYRTWLWNDTATTGLGAEFNKEYRSLYKTQPTGFSGIGFDTAWVLMNAMVRSSDSKNGDEIRKSLSHIKLAELVTRKDFSFEPDRSPKGGVHLFRIDKSGVHFQETLR